MKVFYCKEQSVKKLSFEVDGFDLIARMWEDDTVVFSGQWNIPGLFQSLKTNSNNFTVKVYYNDAAFTKAVHIMPSRDDMKTFVRNMLVSESGGYSKGIAFVIFFNGVNDYCIVSTAMEVKPTVFVDLEKVADPDAAALNYYPNFKANMKRYKAKQELLRKLDCNDSLCGNEAQVDILTKIVKVLAAKYPDEVAAAVPEYQQFFQVSDETSVLTLKTTAGAIADMKKQKENIRNAQQEYFRSK